MQGVTVFVLAGGQSTRMGSDKALLRLEGETLLERALQLAKAVGAPARIVGARERYAEFGAEVVEDEFPNCGPLAGIHAALGASDTELNIVLAVDTPMVTADFLRYLVHRAQAQSDALATVPDADGGIQGTCAVYRRPFRAVAAQQLSKGKYRITDALALVRVEYVEENEIRDAGFDPAKIFANLNTPAEFARAEEK
jgi:molybdenum cofactor guanylyltransferase